MDVEKALYETDFSRLSKRKETLKAELMERFQEELNIEELDHVVAAGRHPAMEQRNLKDRIKR